MPRLGPEGRGRGGGTNRPGGRLGIWTCHAELWDYLTLELGSTFRSFLDLKGLGCEEGVGWWDGV